MATSAQEGRTLRLAVVDDALRITDPVLGRLRNAPAGELLEVTPEGLEVCTGVLGVEPSATGVLFGCH